MVEDGSSALLVAVGDVEKMAASALRVLDDAALREALTTAGLRVASAYAWPRVRDQWLSLYRRLAIERAGCQTTE